MTSSHDRLARVYVGRIVAVGRTRGGANAVLYRVSSRSFPNRKAVELGGHLAIIPRDGHEGDLRKSPYLSYNCLRVAGEWAVASNGSHTDPIVEKIGAGMPVRDALATVLLAMDYEKDDYRTPRIAAAIPAAGDQGWLGIVRCDALVVKAISLEAGRAVYLATYQADEIRETQISEFDAASAVAAARFAVDGGAFAELEHPVTAAAALVENGRFSLATWVV